MAELGAFFGNPNIQRQGARARALAGQRDVNTLADPRTYAIVQGLLGTAPDQMGLSVLNPDYEKIRKAAEPAFVLGLLGQAAPLLMPVASGANRAAMAVGRASERYAEKVVPRIMERGGLPASLLEGMAQGSISPMDVWHGSPHGPFKKFDATKIGTGEGAQAYGYGHYLGEARATGEGYRKALTGNQNSDQFVTTIDGNPTDSFVAKAIIREGGKPEPFIAKMQSKLENQLQKLKKASKEDELGLGFTDYDMELMDIDKTRKIINEAEGYIGKEVKAEPAGYLYKVDLPDEAIAKMLDYDKPIKDQPEVLKAIRNQIQDADIEKSFDANVKSGISGANAMKNYVWGKTPAEQSEALRQAGVTGIRYLDAGSRNIESGTSNFIVFPKNENLLTIKEINDRPITSLLE